MATGRLKTPSCSVYFGKLDARVTAEHLKELGVQAGPVKRANRKAENAFGFVEYDDVESAIYCVGLYHGLLKLFGSKVEVNFSNAVIGDIDLEAQKLLDRCEQLLDIALSTDINAGAGAVRRGGHVAAQRYTPYGDARGHREQRTRAPTRFNNDYDDYNDSATAAAAAAAAGGSYGLSSSRPAQSYAYQQQQDAYAHPRPMTNQNSASDRREPTAQQPYAWPAAATSHVPQPAPLGANAVAAMQAAASAAAAAAAAGQAVAQVSAQQATLGSWQVTPQSAPLQVPAQLSGSHAPSQSVIAVLQALVPQQQQQQQPAVVQEHVYTQPQQYQQPTYQPQQQQHFQYQVVQPVQAVQAQPPQQQYQQPAYQPQVYQQWHQEQQQQQQQQQYQAAPPQYTQQWQQQQPATAPAPAVVYQANGAQAPQAPYQVPAQQQPPAHTVVWYQ